MMHFALHDDNQGENTNLHHVLDVLRGQLTLHLHLGLVNVLLLWCEGNDGNQMMDGASKQEKLLKLSCICHPPLALWQRAFVRAHQDLCRILMLVACKALVRADEAGTRGRGLTSIF